MHGKTGNTTPLNEKCLVWIQNAFAFVLALCFLYGTCALFMKLASMDFNKFFFKIGSHGTIYTFKNYFATVFSVFSNKRYPNRPAWVWIPMKNENYFTIQLIFATIYGLYCTFGTIYEPHCTISTNFYLYLHYFQQ